MIRTTPATVRTVCSWTAMAARALLACVLGSMIAVGARAGTAGGWLCGGGLRLRGGARGLNRGDFEELERAAEEQTQALEAEHPDAAARWRALQAQWNERAEAIGATGMSAAERGEMFDPDIPIRRDVMQFLLEGPSVRCVRRSHAAPAELGRGRAGTPAPMSVILVRHR